MYILYVPIRTCMLHKEKEDTILFQLKLQQKLAVSVPHALLGERSEPHTGVFNRDFV